MAKINDGRPAFPQSIHPDGPFGGMTLREWYIGQALVGLCSNKDIADDEFDYTARIAITQVDVLMEMLKARKGEG